jgi:hypothetical protein
VNIHCEHILTASPGQFGGRHVISKDLLNEGSFFAKTIVHFYSRVASTSGRREGEMLLDCGGESKLGPAELELHRPEQETASRVCPSSLYSCRIPTTTSDLES